MYICIKYCEIIYEKRCHTAVELERPKVMACYAPMPVPIYMVESDCAGLLRTEYSISKINEQVCITIKVPRWKA